MKVSAIDSLRLLIRVEQGKGRKGRHAMLSPQLLDVLRACGDTTARYAQVAANLLRSVASPLDRLTLTKDRPPPA